MRIYLAASYSRRLEMLDRAGNLQQLGHEITSRWIDGHHETRPDVDDNGTSDEREQWAREDISNINDSDLLIVCNDAPETLGRGGRHWEAGYAFGRGLSVWSVGESGNVFYHIKRPGWLGTQQTRQFANWGECVDALIAVEWHRLNDKQARRDR